MGQWMWPGFLINNTLLDMVNEILAHESTRDNHTDLLYWPSWSWGLFNGVLKICPILVHGSEDKKFCWKAMYCLILSKISSDKYYDMPDISYPTEGIFKLLCELDTNTQMKLLQRYLNTVLQKLHTFSRSSLPILCQLKLFLVIDLLH